jgi:hypothetical protein
VVRASRLVSRQAAQRGLPAAARYEGVWEADVIRSQNGAAHDHDRLDAQHSIVASSRPNGDPSKLLDFPLQLRTAARARTPGLIREDDLQFPQPEPCRSKPSVSIYHRLETTPASEMTDWSADEVSRTSPSTHLNRGGL